MKTEKNNLSEHDIEQIFREVKLNESEIELLNRILTNELSNLIYSANILNHFYTGYPELKLPEIRLVEAIIQKINLLDLYPPYQK